jgi:hypothetical protein
VFGANVYRNSTADSVLGKSAARDPRARLLFSGGRRLLSALKSAGSLPATDVTIVHGEEQLISIRPADDVNRVVVGSEGAEPPSSRRVTVMLRGKA